MRNEGKSLSRSTFARAEEKLLTNKRKRSLKKNPRVYINYDWWRLAQKKSTKQQKKSWISGNSLFFGWSIYRFQSIVECRVLFKTSVRRLRKLPISYMLAAIAKSKCAESYRTGKESRLSTSIFVLVFLFFSSRWIFLDLFRDPEIAVRFLRCFCFHAWRVLVYFTKHIWWSVKHIILRSDDSPINWELIAKKFHLQFE